MVIIAMLASLLPLSSGPFWALSSLPSSGSAATAGIVRTGRRRKRERRDNRRRSQGLEEKGRSCPVCSSESRIK